MMQISKALIVLGLAFALTSCDPKQHSSDSVKEQVLAACKVATLQIRQAAPDQYTASNDIISFFDACMASKGYPRNPVSCPAAQNSDEANLDYATEYVGSPNPFFFAMVKNCYVVRNN